MGNFKDGSRESQEQTNAPKANKETIEASYRAKEEWRARQRALPFLEKLRIAEEMQRDMEEHPLSMEVPPPTPPA